LKTADSPRVRFAPSPTGYLHIGGARTALFNFLYARNQGGKFLLRIEDTDLERSSTEMIQYILDGLDWLGIHPDEPYILQSENRHKHVAAAEKLLANGKAYRCFCGKAELDAQREAAQAAGKAYHYPGTCRHLSKTEIEEKLQANLPYTVRLKIPDGVTRFKDLVFKKINVNNSELDDFIILRSDRTPVYQLAVVVDDADMGITHVIRGEDHLSNTPKQILLYLALELPVPVFGHVPLILGSDGKRLSKRAGATSVGEFQELGFVPEAVINSLALLGWSPKSNQTLFTMPELIENFDMAGISKKGAIFDFDKMKWINGQHLSRIPAESLFPAVSQAWLDAGYINDADREKRRDYLLQSIELLKERVRLINEFVIYGGWFFSDPVKYDTEGVSKHWQANDSLELFSQILKSWQELKVFTAESTETSLRRLADHLEIKAARLIHAVRLAITGFTVSPGLFQVLEHLGAETVLRRLYNAISFLQKSAGEK
jgi:glutamyl-tRNA synthetase